MAQTPESKTILEMIASVGAVVTAVILALGAFKMMIWGEHFNIPFFNYLNFSNLIQYAFGEIRTLIVDIFFTVTVFLLWKQWFIEKLGNLNVWLVTITSVILGILVIICTKFLNIRECQEYWVVLVLQFGIFAAGLALKKCTAIKQFELVKLSLFALFLFSFVKINSNVEFTSIQANRNKFYSVIMFKDSARKTDIIKANRYIITNTFDYVFVQNDSPYSVTIIPTNEISSITTAGIFPLAPKSSFCDGVESFFGYCP
jgi:hypothetical protein